jgi:diacylglycerol kinase
MKGQRFLARLSFAAAGLQAAWRCEASFRTQVRMGLAVGATLLVTRPPAVWVAIVTLAIGLVLAVEAVNAALEALADTLHPGFSRGIGRAKDLAAAAVLITSITAIAIAGAAVCAAL